jgi:hypothetical protein
MRIKLYHAHEIPISKSVSLDPSPRDRQGIRKQNSKREEASEESEGEEIKNHLDVQRPSDFLFVIP